MWVRSLSCGVFLCASVSLAAATYDCTDVTLAGTAVPGGINNNGVIVGGSGSRGFIRDAQGQISYVDYPGASTTRLLSVNNNGVIVGTASIPNSQPAWFTVNLQGNFSPITLPPPYSMTGAAFYGINDNGAISGTVPNPSQVEPKFIILNPDHTVTVATESGNTRFPATPGGLNNSGQLLENYAAPPGFALLRQPSDALSLISFPHPLASDESNAYALNNAGVIAGYINLTPGSAFPNAGFVLDAAGSYSEMVCGGAGTFAVIPTGINDNGVIAGRRAGPLGTTISIATPQPGHAQFSASPASLDFGTVIIGRATPPQTVTITNTGDARLDMSSIEMAWANECCSSADFNVSACISNGNTVSALAPGASCAISIAPLSSPPHTGSVTDRAIIDDSASGAPHTIPVSMFAASSVPPSCAITGSAGPPRQLTFTARDPNFGIQAISVSSSSNANVIVPPFAAGTTSPVTITAVATDPAQNATVQLSITNTGGSSTSCGSSITAGPAQWTGLGGPLLSKAAVAANSDGRLEAFAVGGDSTLWHAAQTAPGGSWNAWSSLGSGSVTGDPAVAVDADGRLEVFVTASNTNLLNLAQTAPGTWDPGNWQTLAAFVQGRPAAVRGPDGRLHVFDRQTNGQLIDWSQSSAGSSIWPGEALPSLTLTSDPVAVVDSDGTIEVFATGPEHALWTSAEPSGAGFSKWTSLGGFLKGDVAAVTRSGSVLVVGRGGDDSLWYRSRTGPSTAPWSDWTGLGGVMIADPAVALNSDGTTDALVIGTNNALWETPITSSAWSSLGGWLVGSGITVFVDNSAILHAFAAGGDQGLWEISQTVPDHWN
jgi:hypothetical protein